jgi:hypothetical protein
VPDEVKQLQPWAADGISLSGLDAANTNCLAWLKSEYLR